MPEVEESIVIERPLATVFRFATDPANVPLFSSNLVEYGVLGGGALRLGSRVAGAIRVAGQRIAFVYEVTEFGPPNRLVAEAVESPVPFRITQRYEEAGAGTLVDWHTESDGYGGLFGKLTETTVISMYARDMRADLQNLKRLIESESG